MVNNITKTIDQVAAAHPEAVVYDELGTTHTYGDLKRATAAFAAWLDQTALPQHGPILYYGDHQFEMAAGFIGGAKAGHPYIPVETGTALPRLKSILATAKPQLVVAIDDFPAAEVGYQGQVLTRDELSEIMQKEVDYPLTHELTGSDTFYILFTSGTTGSPKGVEVAHDNIQSFINWLQGPLFDLPEAGRFLGQAPFSFDLSNFYWLVAFTSGGSVKAVPHAVVQNFGQLFTVLPTLDFSVFVGTPSFADLLLLSPDFTAEKMPALTKLIFCGEELTPSTAQRLFDRFPEAQIFNTYGPTEAAVAITGCEITKEMVAKEKRLPIGFDKPGVTTSIWDGDRQLTEPGAHGEIVISGDSVAKGYLNNPEKTAQNFFKVKGVQSYRTGDAGFIDSAGMRHIIGRIDFQIKLHGFRVELDEVRASLELSPLVKQAVAVPKYDKNGKVSHLIAYVIAAKNDYESEKELTAAIRKSLEGEIMAYMMPTQFVFVAAFPKSANGKIAVKQIIAEANR